MEQPGLSKVNLFLKVVKISHEVILIHLEFHEIFLNQKLFLQKTILSKNYPVPKKVWGKLSHLQIFLTKNYLILKSFFLLSILSLCFNLSFSIPSSRFILSHPSFHPIQSFLSSYPILRSILSYPSLHLVLSFLHPFPSLVPSSPEYYFISS